MRSQTTKHGTQRPSLSRKKSRKLKLLSLLRREDVAGKEREKDGMCPEMVKKEKLSLVPVKPENLEYDDDRDASQYENVSILFNPADSNATLNGLLGDETTTSEEGPLASSSPSYGYGDGVELLRTAMRGREKREGEEKWVRYSEVVAEEVSSRYGGEEGLGGGLGWWRKGLDLKLDYGEILKAWSDKGPLYVGDGGGESPQTVPDLSSLFHVPTEGWNGNWNNMWVVREMEVREEGVEGWKWKKGQREASVMRYKAKRQCRLFSKRIRYQVRKLNADKRPRLKGRFVKRG